MAQTLNITDNNGRTVSLLNASGFRLAEGGGFHAPFAPHKLHAAASIEDQIFVERYMAHLSASSHDNAAVQTQALIDLLIDAWRFWNDPRYKTPILMTAKTDNETDTRYALVYNSPDLAYPDFYDNPFRYHDFMPNFGIGIARFAWQDAIPGVIGSAKTLTASDGPASPTEVHIANFRDDEDVDTIFVDDGGVFSANRAGTAAFDLYPTTAVAGDALYIGSAVPWKHIMFQIGTAGVYSANIFFEYWNGSAWTQLTAGTDYTLYPEANVGIVSQSPFDIAGIWAFSFFPRANWAATTVNGASKYWMRARVDAVTSWTTTPSNATAEPYSQRKPHIDLPAAAFQGDVHPQLLLRLRAPSGGNENEGKANLSRIILGAKSRNLTNFASHINAGGDDNPAAWTVAYGTDAASEASTKGPGGKRASVSFATDATLVSRVQYTGDDLLDDYVGLYRIFGRVEQVGGAAGDCSVKLRILIGSTNVYAPKYDTPEIDLVGADVGQELVEFHNGQGGPIAIPFGEKYNADSLGAIDLIFQIHAARATGAAVLKIYDLILIPVDEWSATLDDPISDSTNGNSALRGGTGLDLDGGLVDYRLVKFINAGATPVLAENWILDGRPLRLEPATQYRLYFLLAHYPTTWGQPPLDGALGMHLTAQVYGASRFLALRGNT